MIDLPHSPIVEAAEEPDFFGFRSPDFGGLTGVGHSVEDCLYKAKWGMKEHDELLREEGLSVPAPNPTITAQYERKAAVA